MRVSSHNYKLIQYYFSFFDVRGNIIYRVTQFHHGYADDIVLIARNITARDDMFQSLEKQGQEKDLKISKQKINYIKICSL